MRLARKVLMAMAVLIVATTALAQDRRPDARLEWSSTAYGLLVGVNQGKGVLAFQGQRYPFTVSGLRLATLGFVKVDALGQVYRLRELADFPGRYLAVEGGLTVVQGGGHTVLRNEKGVTLYLQNVQKGFDVTLGGGGLDIALTEPPAPAKPVKAAAPAQPAAALPPLDLITPPRR